MDNITKEQILNGHRSFETAYKVEDYPYGFRLRTIIYYWIETTKKRGDRFCSCTIDPKNGRLNKPKKSTYSPFLFMYLENETGHVKNGGVNFYSLEEAEKNIKFIVDVVEEATNEQIENLRSDYFQHVRGNAPYQLVKYSDETKPAFKEWIKRKLIHIIKSEITDWTKFPPAPVEDNPDGEVKMVVTTYEPQNTEDNG